MYYVSTMIEIVGFIACMEARSTSRLEALVVQPVEYLIGNALGHWLNREQVSAILSQEIIRQMVGGRAPGGLSADERIIGRCDHQRWNL
jgi:hypothetical protein